MSNLKCKCQRCINCNKNRIAKRKVCAKCRDGRCECKICGQIRKKIDTTLRCYCYKNNKKKEVIIDYDSETSNNNTEEKKFYTMNSNFEIIIISDVNIIEKEKIAVEQLLKLK